jgi:hypothetical protein
MTGVRSIETVKICEHLTLAKPRLVTNPGFEVIKAVKVQVSVFWVLTPFNVVVGHCCLRLHPEDVGVMVS